MRLLETTAYHQKLAELEYGLDPRESRSMLNVNARTWGPPRLCEISLLPYLLVKRGL